MNATTNRRTIARSVAAVMAVAIASTFAPWHRVSAASPASDAALARVLTAENPGAAAKAADGAVKAGVTFDEAYAALRKGRSYKADAPKGIVKASHTLGDLTFNYQLEVPDSYDPAKAYQLRIQLHGGVGSCAGGLRGAVAPRVSGVTSE